ncbi:MAG: methyltransferase domain-containing protein [Casimicrobiaceae bacterium]
MPIISGSPAEAYEQYFVPAMFFRWAQVLLRHAKLRQGEHVLDVACGTGIVSRTAAPLVGPEGRIVGLDINPAMLDVARTSTPPSGAGIDWHQGDALALPFTDGSFDAVLCQHGMQFFPDRGKAVREMCRVLKPGGRATVIVLDSLDRHPVFETIMRSVARHLSCPVSAAAKPFDLSDPEELLQYFTSAGFESTNLYEESIMATFPDPQRFVLLAVTSSAAAIPTFAQLDGLQRARLIDDVSADAHAAVNAATSNAAVSFPMYAHVVNAIK